MPVNKNALFRYRVLDSLFRHRRGYTIDQLVDIVSEKLNEAFGLGPVSKRTIYYDMNIMKSLPPRGFNAPIRSYRGYYRYADPHFSIFPARLSYDEVNVLAALYIQLSKKAGIALSGEQKDRLIHSLEKILRAYASFGDADRYLIMDWDEDTIGPSSSKEPAPTMQSFRMMEEIFDRLDREIFKTGRGD